MSSATGVGVTTASPGERASAIGLATVSVIYAVIGWIVGIDWRDYLFTVVVVGTVIETARIGAPARHAGRRYVSAALTALLAWLLTAGDTFGVRDAIALIAIAVLVVIGELGYRSRRAVAPTAR